MAITAVITLSDSTVSPNMATTATCTVSNSGGSSVNVTGIDPYMVPDATTKRSVAGQAGFPALGPGMTVAVAAAGELAISYPIVAFAPQSGEGWQNPSSYVYDIGAIVYTSDGSVTTATVAELTVSAPTHPT